MASIISRNSIIFLIPNAPVRAINFKEVASDKQGPILKLYSFYIKNSHFRPLIKNEFREN